MLLLQRDITTNSLFKDCNNLKFDDKIVLGSSILEFPQIFIFGPSECTFLVELKYMEQILFV